MMKVFAGFFLTMGMAAVVLADSPEWRGAKGDGVVAEGKFPETWSAEENVLWKADLPAPGNSTPVVSGERVFVTCANVDGDERSLLAFDRKSGEQLWKRTVKHEETDPTHPTNPWCAPSPATDGKLVFVWNGSAGATAYDFDGNEVWHRDLGDFVHMWGHGSSPRVFEETVIFFGSPGPRVLLTALDKRTGETLWERVLDEVASPPEDLHGSFVTPFLWPNGDRMELLVPLPGFLASFDPRSGEEIWRFEGLGGLVYTDAMVSETMILAFSGYRGPSIGMRRPTAEERGNLTESHGVWRNEEIVQRVGSGMIVGERFYLCGRNGELQCGDLRTGEILWTQPLREQAWSAISLLNGKLWLTDQAAKTRIFEAADEFKLLRENVMAKDERTNSTLVFSEGQVFLRTYERLYAIGEEDGGE